MFCFAYLLLCFGLCWVFAAVRVCLAAASQGYSLVVVCGLLIAVASPVTEYGLKGARLSVVVAPRL